MLPSVGSHSPPCNPKLLSRTINHKQSVNKRATNHKQRQVVNLHGPLQVSSQGSPTAPCRPDSTSTRRGSAAGPRAVAKPLGVVVPWRPAAGRRRPPRGSGYRSAPCPEDAREHEKQLTASSRKHTRKQAGKARTNRSSSLANT